MIGAKLVLEYFPISTRLARGKYLSCLILVQRLSRRCTTFEWKMYSY